MRVPRVFLVSFDAAVRVGTLGWLAAHFALTLLFNLPVNPLKLRLQPLLDRTIGAYFHQNWSLFAPNPIAQDEALLARPLTRAEAERAAAGLPTTGWYDLTTPLWEGFHRNRFSAYDRLARPQANLVRYYLGGSPALAPWATACERGEAEACEVLGGRVEEVRAYARRRLGTVASAFANEPTGSFAGASYVALRVRERTAVPWSERRSGKRAVRDLDLGVFPIDRSVVPSGLFAARRLP